MSVEIPATMKAVQIEEVGGPEALLYKDVPVPELASENDVLIKIAYTGLNYIDTYHRTGLYKLPLPAILGREGAGIVAKLGSAVTGLSVGDRVAFIGPKSYAEYASVPSRNVARIPDAVPFDAAVASMLQGLTVQFLLRSTYPVKAGDIVLVHAAAGGVGGLLVQAAKFLGATVIGTVSTDEKGEIAKAHGADHVINYSNYDKSELDIQVRELTGGKGVNVAYDGVGKDTWFGSLKSLRPRGMLVLFGNASGPVPAIDPLLLSKHNSLFVTRPTLFDHITTREEFEERCAELFGWVAEGKIKVTIHKSFDLKDVAEAHKELESRAATGKIVIKVE